MSKARVRRVCRRTFGAALVVTSVGVPIATAPAGAAEVATASPLTSFVNDETGVTVMSSVGSPDGSLRAVTVLSDRGIDTARWEAYGCTNAANTKALVVYAPSEYANAPDSPLALARVATVDLASGAVVRLDLRVKMHYHTPGCGRGDVAVVTDYSSADATTSVWRVDLRAASAVRWFRAAGLATSAVPVADGVVAAVGNTVAFFDASGARTASVPVAGQPTNLVPNRRGGVDALVVGSDDSVSVVSTTSRVAGLRSSRVGDRGKVRLFIGEPVNILAGDVVGDPGASIHRVRAAKPPVAVATDASTALLETHASAGSWSATTLDVASGATRSESVLAESTPVPATPTGVTATPTARAQTPVASAAPAPTAAATATVSPTVSPCAVGRNFRTHQVYQPSTDQIEWAADMAVAGTLTINRAANWGGHGLPAYQPQVLIPRVALIGGGQVPSAILLGVLAQESNLRQASFHAPRGMYGNPLIADYYGSGGGTFVDYSKADCGYGVGQITTGMKTGDTLFSATTQQAIAYDYTVNIAAAQKLLAEKWNQAVSAGVIAQDADARDVESWYFALWAYNTGFNPQNTANPSAPWGVGWTNNPRQPDYDANRAPFLQLTYDDAMHPSSWPYQERVIGFASYGFYENGSRRFTPTSAPITAAPIRTMCSALNNCDPNNMSPTTNSYCLQTDRTLCWWHWPATWPATACGAVACPAQSTPKYTGTSEPANPTPPYTAVCSTAFPAGTVVVGNAAVSNNRAGCPETANAGSFVFTYGPSPSDPAEVDLHQIGGSGYLGQFWFTHTASPFYAAERITGTWTPPASMTGWRKILVHVPALGAESPQAEYTIKASGSATPVKRTLNQRWNANTWVTLGVYDMSSGASVALSNVTYTDWLLTREIDIAWDDIAFVPTTAPVKNYVALGDSYSAGEGVEPAYYPPADIGANTPGFVDNCHRSDHGYPALVAAAAAPSEFYFIACSSATIANVNGDPTFFDNMRGTESPQITQGYLTPQTTAVSITIGGNDGRFGDVVKSCVLSTSDCGSPGYVLAGDTQDLRTTEYQKIDGLRQPLQQLYTQIKSSVAASAKIVVIGYPRLFTPVSGNGCNGLTSAEQVFLNELGDRLDGVIAAAAAAAGVTYYDPNPLFNGKRICDSGEAINGGILFSQSGSGFNQPGSGSFHPKVAGHQLIATAIRPLLGL